MSRKLPICLPKWLEHFTFPSAMNENSCCSTSSAAISAVSVLDFGLSGRLIFSKRKIFSPNVKDHPQRESLLSLFFFFNRATSMAYRSSQARGGIRPAAASLRHSHTGSKPHLRPMPKLIAMLDP